MIKKLLKNKYLVMVGALLVLGVSVLFLSEKQPNMENFKAPGRSWNSPKKVEDYFVERLRMTPEEALGIRSKPGVDGMVNLRINDKTTLDALIGNLYYYGFVRDQDSLRYALEHTKDSTPSNNAIAVDKNRTIDLNAEYRISENMDAWQIADILLNRPSGHFTFDEYNYFFMP
jgi:hypothetical protein